MDSVIQLFSNIEPWCLNFLTLIGTAVTIVGMIVTIYQTAKAKKSKRIAEDAKNEAVAAMESLHEYKKIS